MGCQRPEPPAQALSGGKGPGCPSGSHLVSDHIPVTWLLFPCHRILVVFMSSDTENGEEEPMTLKVQLGLLQSQAIMS